MKTVKKKEKRIQQEKSAKYKYILRRNIVEYLANCGITKNSEIVDVLAPLTSHDKLRGIKRSNTHHYNKTSQANTERENFSPRSEKLSNDTKGNSVENKITDTVDEDALSDCLSAIASIDWNVWLGHMVWAYSRKNEKTKSLRDILKA